MSAQPVEFDRISTAARAMRYATAEIHGDATGEQAQWLDDHRLEWLEALTRMDEAAAERTGTERLFLAGLKPAAGELPSGEYLEAKRQQSLLEARRRVFLTHVAQRRQWLLDHMADSRYASAPRLLDAISTALELLDRGREADAYRRLSGALGRTVS